MGEAARLHNIANVGGHNVLWQISCRAQCSPYANTQRASHAGHFEAVGHAIVNMIVGRQRMHLCLARQAPECTGKDDLVVIRMKRRPPFFILDWPMAKPTCTEQLVPVHSHNKVLTILELPGVYRRYRVRTAHHPGSTESAPCTNAAQHILRPFSSNHCS